MTEEQTIASEVLDNSTQNEQTEAPIETIEGIADETINNIEKEEVATADIDDEDVTLENVKLPEQNKELTKEDHILKRKERQLAKAERERKRNLIDEHNAELERLKKENEEIKNRALVTEINSYRAPLREDFDNDEDFIDSRLKYNFAKNAAERIQQEEQIKISRAKDEFVGKINKVEQKGQEKYEDFDDVTAILGERGVLTNTQLVEAIIDSDYSSDVFYLMGKYPAIREKLNIMEPIKAIKELAKLEQRLEQQLNAKKPVKAQTKIIEPLGGKSGGTVKKPLSEYSESELNKLSAREFTKLRKEEAKRSY